MKRVFRYSLSLIENIIILLSRIKTWIAEWIAIFSKKSKYKHIKWDNGFKKQFNKYWKENYGKKISPRWHKYYESVSGVRNIEYFPEILFSTKLEPKYNNYYYSKVLGDKSLVSNLYNINGLSFPINFLTNINNVYLNMTNNISDLETIIRENLQNGQFIIKPIFGSSSGTGVRYLNLHNGIDESSNQSINEIIMSYNCNFVIQDKLRQSSSLKALHKYSLNTFRVITYILNNKLYHVPIMLRVGTKGSHVDNIHAGGIGVIVNDNGYLNKYGYDNDMRRYEYHPDTKIKFEGYSIKEVPTIINLAYKAHLKTPQLKILSWDFTIGEDNNIYLIEVNTYGQGSWFPQSYSGKSLFGSNTKEILNLIKR